MYDTGSAWLMTSLNPSPITGLGRPGRHDLADVPPDLAGRRAERCRGSAPAPDRRWGGRGGGFDRLCGCGLGWVGEPAFAARDIVPDGHGRRARGAGMASHNPDPRAEVRTRQRDRDRYRELQCRAGDRSGDRRICDRKVQHRPSVLVLLRRQSGAACGADLVAGAAKAEGNSAGRTPDQRHDRPGVRYVRYSREMDATLIRAIAFFPFASAYLALLPLWRAARGAMERRSMAN